MSTPEDDTQSTDPVVAAPSFPRGRALLRRSGRVLGFGLLTLVAYVLVRGMTDPYDSMSLDPGLLVAMGLVGAGVLLLRGQDAPAQEGVDEPVVRPSRSPLGVLTLSVLFLVVGVMILLQNLGVSEIGVGQITAASLFVIGCGLLVGVWWGRSRFLMVVGVLLIPLVIVSGFIHLPLRGAIVGQHLHLRSAEDLKDTYEILAGQLTLDLFDVRDLPDSKVVKFRVAAGNVTLYVPDRFDLTILGDIEYGNANVGRGREAGDDLSFKRFYEGKPGHGHLVIEFHGGIASLYIERIAYSDRYGTPQQRRRERRAEQRREARREERRAERRSERRAQEERRRRRAET